MLQDLKYSKVTVFQLEAQCDMQLIQNHSHTRYENDDFRQQTLQGGGSPTAQKRRASKRFEKHGSIMQQRNMQKRQQE